MDAQLVALAHLNNYDLDTLPYRITQFSSFSREIGHFVPVTPTDFTAVQNWTACGNGNRWYPGCSAFHSIWTACISGSVPEVLKLCSTNDPTNTIQGLLRIDQNKPCEDHSQRLLETAPDNQNGVVSRRFSGIGKALIARLVIECYFKGHRTLFIRVHPRNVPFYNSLYFVASPSFPGRMALDLQDAEQLLKEFFFNP